MCSPTIQILNDGQPSYSSSNMLDSWHLKTFKRLGSLDTIYSAISDIIESPQCAKYYLGVEDTRIN